MTKAKTEIVDHPPHYTRGKFEAIDVIEDLTQFYPRADAFSIGCVLKYLFRAPHKGDLVENLKKAQWYLNRAIANMESH